MSDRQFSPNLDIRDLVYIGVHLHFSCLQAAIAAAVYVLNHGTGGQALGVTTLVSNRKKFIPWTSRFSECFLKGLQNSCQVSMADAKEDPCRTKGL